MFMSDRYFSNSEVVAGDELESAKPANVSSEEKDAWVFDGVETLLFNLPYYEHGYGYLCKKQLGVTKPISMAGPSAVDFQKTREFEKDRALLEWHRTSRFCGQCGSKTIPREASIGKCTTKQINPNDPFEEIDYSKCCSELRTGVADPKCFCTIEGTYNNYIPPNITAFNGTVVQPRKPPFSEVELEYNKIFQNCSIDTTYAKLCDGVVTNSESEAGRMYTKIISIMGLIPSALFVWMI